MRQSIWLAATALSVLGGSAQAATVTIACGAVGIERQLCQSGSQAWAEKTGHNVQLISVPDSSSQRYTFYRNQLSRGSGTIDVYQVDVVWPGLLGEHFVDLSKHIDAAQRDRHIDSLIANNTVNGRLVAMPWYVDVGLLYYRKDLLKEYDLSVPKTWSDLEDAARTIQQGERAERGDNPDAVDEKRFWGFVFQGNNYEGLTCDALEWVSAHGGGQILDPQTGEITINNTQARRAFSLAGSWPGDIAPSTVTQYQETDSHVMFRRGQAAFMRNWPYAYELTNNQDSSEVQGKVGVAPLPKGDPGYAGTQDVKHASVLGGWQLSVARYSDNPEAAADLVAYLTSKAEQKRRAIEGAYLPTIESLYDDSEILNEHPHFADMRTAVRNAVPRPSGTAGQHYLEVSTAFWTAAHRVLKGDRSAATALDTLEAELARIRGRSGGW